MLPSGDGVPSIGGQVRIGGEVGVGVGDDVGGVIAVVGGVVVVVVLAAVELDVVEVVVVGGQCSGIARQACKTNLSRMANSPLKSSTKK